MDPKANIMRTEDDATAAAAYLSGQADLLATNSLIVARPREAEPEQGVRPQVRHPPQPGAHGRAHGRAHLVRWLDSFIFFNMNGELDRLHQKWLGCRRRGHHVAGGPGRLLAVPLGPPSSCPSRRSARRPPFGSQN